MYRKGLGRRKIAELTGAAPATVAYHLGVARTLHPGLQAEHQAAAGPRAARPTDRERARLEQLLAMVQGTGRYPSRTAIDASERTLATWLQRRRNEERAGMLSPVLRDALAGLPGWQNSRALADEATWHKRLAALGAYRASGQDWPRHHATVPDEEHELGVWLHAQRYKLRRGDLDPAKAKALDAEAPGWRTGRQRGRKVRVLRILN
jgi:hypothetical protein